jgi:hypothetical protein
MIPEQQLQAPTGATIEGTLDSSGAGDHDQPYRFGRKPSAMQPFPFSTHEFARLLIVRGRLQSGAWQSLEESLSHVAPSDNH